MKHYFLSLFIIFTLASCNEKKQQKYLCDAEILSSDRQSFVTESGTFKGGGTQTSIDAYKGKFSSIVNVNQNRGIEKEINNLEPGEIITVSVHKKTESDKGYLVITSGNNNVIRRERFSYSGKDENGWEKIEFEIQLPFDLRQPILPNLNIYVSLFDPLRKVNKESKEKVLFDNLEIRRKSSDNHEESFNKKSTDFKEINIQIEDKDFKKLINERDDAFYNQVISKSNKKKIKGYIKTKNNNVPVKIRLKGDWTDHIIGKKWSLRIETDNNELFQGLKEFSLQSPETRDFLNEWLFHEICHQENILSTYYDFYRLKINGVNYGIYALEEHFRKQLLESKGRINGPILKFDEEGFWECRKYQKTTKKYSKKPVFLASVIKPFNKKEILNDKKLNQQFVTAQYKLLKYKLGEKNPSEYLDVSSFAKSYALMSITNAEHSFIWHNQRFYFNPKTSKLEIIAFDCFEGAGEYAYRKHVFYGKNSWTVKPDFYCILSLFNDTTFQKEYLFYLKKFSNKNYLEKILTQNKDEIAHLEEIIQEDYPKYRFDRERFFSGRNNILEKLSEYESKITTQQINYQKINEVKTDCYPDEIFNNISINAHVEKTINDSSLLSIKNYHCTDLMLIGYSLKEGKIIYFEKPIKIKSYRNFNRDIQILTGKCPEKLYYIHKEEVYSCDIINWPRPILKKLGKS